jgi:hypothetical protein
MRHLGRALIRALPLLLAQARAPLRVSPPAWAARASQLRPHGSVQTPPRCQRQAPPPDLVSSGAAVFSFTAVIIGASRHNFKPLSIMSGRTPISARVIVRRERSKGRSRQRSRTSRHAALSTPTCASMSFPWLSFPVYGDGDAAAKFKLFPRSSRTVGATATLEKK